MTYTKVLMCFAALTLLAFVCGAVIGASSSDDGVTSSTTSVNASKDNTVSVPDFDGDGTIGFGDFVMFAAKFGLGQSDDGYDEQYDLNGDAEIGFSDFIIFARFFGTDVSSLVSIPDANLRAAIERALGKDSGAPITQNEVKTLTRLSASDRVISELTGLEHAANLTHLYCGYNQIRDLSPLAGLPNLAVLDLWGNDVSDISPLTGLTNLTALELNYNPVADLSPLGGLVKLSSLGLFYCATADISVLSGLTNLKYLTVGGDPAPLTDISPLAGLTNLKGLGLARNDISDISPLSGLINLEFLQLGSNDIRDISPLRGLPKLTELYLGINLVVDISPLAGLTDLTKLDLLDNPIEDLSPLSGMARLVQLELGGSDVTNLSTLAFVLSGLNSLTSLRLSTLNITELSTLSGLTNLTALNLSGNSIKDISALSGLTNLEELVLSKNQIEDISSLAELTGLNYLQLASNELTDVSPLAGLARLIYLNLRFNGITDISALGGLTNLKNLDVRGNPLSDASIAVEVSDLMKRGTDVLFDQFPETDFDIELVFDNSFNEREKHVLEWAARRWMAVIVDDVPDYVLVGGWEGSCGDQSFEIPPGERIDDVRIFVTSFRSGPAGWGGPVMLREESHLPVLGCMAFQTQGISLLTTGLHELGHVLGFGTIWEDLGLYQNAPDGDEHFNGPLAIAAFNDAGGWHYMGKKVPLDDPGHWRDEIIRAELMGPGGGRSLSAITVQSFADLGYGVDVTQADPYTLLGAASKPVAKIALPGPDRPGLDASVSWPHFYLQRGEGPHGQRRVEGDFPSILTDGGHTGGPDRAERVWRRGMAFDLAESRQRWDAGFPTHTAPELTCGAGLMDDPIYVVDPQGRIVRTISR